MVKYLFKAVEKKTIPEEVASNIRRFIFSGKIKPGDKLPAERELALIFKTNRNTMREALRILQSQRLINVRQGAGIEVLDFGKTGDLSMISLFIKDGIESPLNLKILEEMLNFRKFFFITYLPESVKNISEEKGERVNKIFQELKREWENENTLGIFEKDGEFFRVLVEFTESILNMWTFNTIFTTGSELIKMFGRWWEFPDFYIFSMERIRDAVLEKSPLNFKHALQEHFEKMDTFTMEKAKELIKKVST